MDIQKLLDQASKLRIAVVGDLILDRYIDGEVSRISPEAPVLIVKITGTRENPGGAGNVVENLRGLGCQVKLFHNEKQVVIKTRVMSGGHHILRLDDEDAPQWMKFDDLDWELWHGIENKQFDVVVISDYGKGVCSHDVVSKLIRLCNDYEVPVAVDTKASIGWMHHATLVKCNRREWEAYLETRTLGDTPLDFMTTKDVKSLVITNGDRGMMYFSKSESDELSGNIPGLKVSIADSCGAGDTVISVLGICMALSIQIHDACTLANHAAAQVCTRPGVSAVTKQDLMKYDG